jgi:phage repressor protein C with HTH and peptisase S24 domain
MTFDADEASGRPHGSTGTAAPIGGRGLREEVWLPLLRDALKQQGRFTFPLRGNSMRPTLPVECDIEVLPLAGSPKLGQIIVFVADDTLVAHRFVRRSGKSLIAQGDNRRGPDRPLRQEQIVGRVAGASISGEPVWPRRGEALLVEFWLARYHLLRAARWVKRRMPR